MNAGESHSHSHLFTLRLWDEQLYEGQVEWRGRVQHVESGNVRYLRDWNTLLSILLGMMEAEDDPPEQALPGRDK